jgi:hypothetical protein
MIRCFERSLVGKHQIYYHIYANELGCSIAKEQLLKLTALIPDASIHCGVIEIDKQSLANLLTFIHRMPTVTVFATSNSGNEWLTLKKLHSDCISKLTRDQPVLYCHTKGAVNTSRQPTIVPLWREWMEYFCFFRYQDAIKSLIDGYTAYGFDICQTPRRKFMLMLGFRPCFRFFSGNYWWATAGAIRKIRLEGIPMDQRHSAEGNFLSRIPYIKPFDALNLIGLSSRVAGAAYTNYNDDFLHFNKLSEKADVLNEMRDVLRSSAT